MNKKPLQQDAKEKIVEFRLPSDPKVLKIVRLAVSHLCELAGFSPEERNGTTLAVDEACANIIQHAYDGNHSKPIVVRCRLLGNGIQVQLQDFGRSVKKSEIKSRDLDDVRPGGLGVHLINSVMDVVNYKSSAGNGNQLTLAKYVQVK